MKRLILAAAGGYLLRCEMQRRLRRLTRRENAALSGRMDLQGLLDKTPRRGER